MKAKLKALVHAILLSGVFVLILGLYFVGIKAGIPYQDPTTEMTIRWMAYQSAGEVCARFGISIFAFGLVGWLVNKFLEWK